MKLTANSGMVFRLCKGAFKLDVSSCIKISKRLVMLSVVDATTSYDLCVRIGEASSGGEVIYCRCITSSNEGALFPRDFVLR